MRSIPTDLPQGQDRQHRTIIANTVNDLIKVRPPNDATEAEISAGVTPINYAYPPGDVRRYQNSVGGIYDVSDTADWTAAIQAAMDCNTVVYLPAIDTQNGSFYGLSAPLYIRDTQAQNLMIIGGGRTNTYLHPLDTDISDALGYNAFFINLADNGKFSLFDLRFWSGNAYTGVVIECEDGATGGVEAIFSGSIENCWFGLSSQNTGMIHGGLSNYRVQDNVWEFCKGCLVFEGAGISDVICNNNQLFFCFDEFLSISNTTDCNLITVTNLHAYLHQRGRAVTIEDVFDVKVSNVTVQMVSGVSNLGGGGVLKLDGCRNVVVNGVIATNNSSLGTGDMDAGITIEDTLNARFSNVVIEGADDGVLLTGSGINSLTFDNCDFVNCVTASFRVPSGAAPQGRLTMSNVNMSDGNIHLMIFIDEADIDVTCSDCRFMNAGLGSDSGSRNIAISTTGRAQFTDCIIGQNNGSAAASHFINSAGTGILEFLHPTIIGTPPTALRTGSQAANFIYKSGDGGTIASSATITLPFYGDTFLISGTTNITSVTASDCAGRRVALIFQDVLTFTDGSNLKLNGNFVTSADDTITLTCDGTNWYEVSRSAN